MPPSGLLSLSHGQRKNGTTTPAEQAAQQQNQRQPPTQSMSYASMAGKQRMGNPGQGQGHQYGLYQRNQGASNSGGQDRRPGR